MQGSLGIVKSPDGNNYKVSFYSATPIEKAKNAVSYDAKDLGELERILNALKILPWIQIELTAALDSDQAAITPSFDFFDDGLKQYHLI